MVGCTFDAIATAQKYTSRHSTIHGSFENQGRMALVWRQQWSTVLQQQPAILRQSHSTTQPSLHGHIHSYSCCRDVGGHSDGPFAWPVGVTIPSSACPLGIYEVLHKHVDDAHR